MDRDDQKRNGHKEYNVDKQSVSLLISDVRQFMVCAYYKHVPH